MTPEMQLLQCHPLLGGGITVARCSLYNNLAGHAVLGQGDHRYNRER